MTALSFLTRFRPGPSNTLARSKPRVAARSKPRNVEMLEGRQLLSTLSVKSHLDSAPRSIHPAIVETAKPATHATTGNHAIAHSAADTSITYLNNRSLDTTTS